ncbi:unnamed protein product [Alopecurus aequalis]
MADIAFSSFTKILNLALEIKKAVDTVQQNKKDCHAIGKLAARVTEIMKPQQDNGDIMQNPAMRDPLKDMEESLECALNLVTKCQEKHFVRHLFTAASMSKQLKEVKDDINQNMLLGIYATTADMNIAWREQNQSVDASPPQGPQYAGQVNISHSAHTRTDQSRPDRQKGKTIVATQSSAPSDPLSGIAKFTLSQLKAATTNFSNVSVIRRGRFSIVYKGVLHDGVDVAIKRLLISDDFPHRHLDHEINISAKLRHKNIVKLLGYCFDTEVEERVYFSVQEYIPKGNLKSIMGASRFDWPSCFKIILGIAKGVYYLHKQRVLHRNLNPTNILFESDMTPVIIDFGLSVILDGDDNVTISDSFRGTRGYIAPEKNVWSNLSTKSDVFSFGIILIEIISGRRVSPYGDQQEWASIEMIRAMKGLLDPELVDGSQLTDINRCIKVGLKCTEWDMEDRPTMEDVLESLNS